MSAFENYLLTISTLLTDAQKRELDRRLESTRTNPGQSRTWDEIRAEFMKSR